MGGVNRARKLRPNLKPPLPAISPGLSLAKAGTPGFRLRLRARRFGGLATRHSSQSERSRGAQSGLPIAPRLSIATRAARERKGARCTLFFLAKKNEVLVACLCNHLGSGQRCETCS
jgi:hypothetical protein